MSERKVAYQKRRLRYRLETKSFDGKWRDRLGFRTLLGAKMHATVCGYEDYRIVDSRGAAEFDRMIAEVERAAAEKAWDEGYWQGINGHTGPGNPYLDAALGLTAGQEGETE